MSSKENMPPVKDRKSKIPVPSMLPVRKGIKRAVSPNACKSDPKRSPSTSKRSSEMNKGRPETRQFGNQQRKILGELPCEQRKIVKVHRALNKSPLTKQKAAKRQPMVKRSTLKKETGVSSCTSGFGVGDLSLLPDQSGIEFETDDSALQSILDETGIQYVQPQHGNQPQMSKFSRHTLAAVPKAQKESIGPSRIKVEDFRKVCDDFISRTTSKQPNAKRHCREPEFKNEDNFNLKLTPSKTDFCKKFGVEKNITFKGVTPGYVSRQSLPGRTKVRQPDPFIIPGRCSMISQASRRLAMVGEEEILCVTPGRASIAPQTPLRVPRKMKNMEDAAQLENEVFSGNVNRHQTPGRVSLSSQKPGRVSLSAQIPGRPSLSSQTPGRVSLSAQTPGRVSLSAQTPGRTSLALQTPSRASLYDKSCNIQSVGRPSLITQPPGRVSLSAQHPPSHNKYDNLSSEGKLATQTPGRVSLSSVQNPRQHRVSMIDQTPGRVKIQDQSKDKEDNDTKKTDSLCENLAKKFLMDTPEKVDNPDIVSKVSKNKTPVREKAAGMCSTPLRVKLLQTDQSTPKSTPQRVLKPANTMQHTPQRVQVQGVTKSSSTPQEPMRVAKKVGTPITPIRVSVMSPGVLPRQPADIKQETPSRKTPSKSKMSDGVDLRTIWKTKKTPSKSPIMKEVLVKEEEGSSSDVSTPKNHKEGLPGAVAISIKKKKTLTWADALESCQTTTGVSETKDEQCASLQIKPETFHNAMQDSPNQEKTTSSPDKNNHVTTLTNSLNSLNNMQLPVCLTGSSSTHSASPSGGIDNENQPDITDCCSNADHTLVSHPTTSFAQLESDSLLVSQQEVGQHKSNVLANKTQDEFLQKQIELFNEKKRQLAKLQMQIQEQLYKASDVEPVSSHHDAFSVGLVQSTAEEQSANRNENRQKDCNTLTEQVDNQHYSRNLNVLNQDFTYKSDTLTQGINVSRQVNLDLNSNVTVSDDTFENLHNVNVKENLSAPSLHPPDHFSGTQNEIEVFCTPTQQRVRLEEEENITPYILKLKSNLKEVTETGEGRNQPDVGSQLLNLSDKNEEVGVPLWTPLAMKTVAKQQAVGDNFDIFSIENTKRDIKSETDIIAKSEIDISVINSEHSGDRVNGLVPNTSIIESSTKSGVCGEQCPKTPPNKRSAFRSLSSSGLTPVVGSLSLRGNTDVKFETRRMHQSDSLHNCVLRAANERYLEALLDDEVSLFMCRLSPSNGLKKGRDFCHDPVARILLGGDDMHFIPIEMDSSDLNRVHIDGSAFTKFATRAT